MLRSRGHHGRSDFLTQRNTLTAARRLVDKAGTLYGCENLLDKNQNSLLIFKFLINFTLLI